MIVSRRQQTNPVLRHIRNVRWEFGAPLAGDFQVGEADCVLFLSLQFHVVNPDYILGRMEEVKEVGCALRVLLLLLPWGEPPRHHLTELNHLAAFYGFTLICASSNAECARYLETFKAHERKSPKELEGPAPTDHRSSVVERLTLVKGVNKTNAATLLSRFGSLAGVMTATEEQLSSCPGISTSKMRTLHKTFHAPFCAAGQTESPAED